MAFWSKQNLPAVPPKQEVLPPESNELLPERPENRGLSRSLTTGLKADLARRTDAKIRDHTAVQAELIEQQTRVARNLQGLVSEIAKVHDLPNTLVDQQEERDHQRALNVQRRTRELREGDERAWQAQRHDEREREHAAMQQLGDRERDRAAYENAHRAAVVAERSRIYEQTIADLVVAKGRHNASKEEIDAHIELLRAELFRTQAFAGVVGHTPQQPHPANSQDLQNAIEILKAQKRDAHANSQPFEVIGALDTAIMKLDVLREEQQKKATQ